MNLDDLLSRVSGGRLRQHGPEPTRPDSEVITVEVIGMYLGLIITVSC